MKSHQARHGVVMLALACLAAFSSIARSQVTNFIMPATLPGFTEIAHGTIVAPPRIPPGPHPLVLRVSTPSQPNSRVLRLNGLTRVDTLPAGGERLVFSPSSGGGVIDIRVRLPFELRRLFSGVSDTELRYLADYDYPGPNRSLAITLQSESQDQLWVIERTADAPISLELDGAPFGIGVNGLRVHQGGVSASTPSAAHDYTHPVSVDIRTRDGRTSRIWQGQRVRIPSDTPGQSVYIAVLVGEVARPTGNAIYRMEHAPFALHLLIVTETR